MLEDLDVENDAETSEQKRTDTFIENGYVKVEIPDRYNHRIHNAYVLGRLEKCKQLIDELLDKSSEAICEYALLLRALIAREEGEIKESMIWLQKILTHNPGSSQIIYEIGRTHLLLGEHQAAIGYFQKAIENNPNDWRYYYWKATALYHLRGGKGRPNPVVLAQECLLQCPRMNKSVDMLMFVAKTCVQRGELRSAIESYHVAQELEPENLDVNSHLGLLYLKAGDEDKAFSCLGEALTYDTNHLPSLMATATVLQLNGDLDAALTKYRIATALCDHDGPLWNNVGVCFLGRGKLVAAISCLKRANYLSPLDWKILFNLGVVYYWMMQYSSAFNFMTAAMNLNPRNASLIMSVASEYSSSLFPIFAVILTELQDHANARKAYKKALRLQPNDYVGRLNFAVFEYRHGNIESSVKQILQLSPLPEMNKDESESLNLLCERLKSCIRMHYEGLSA